MGKRKSREMVGRDLGGGMVDIGSVAREADNRHLISCRRPGTGHRCPVLLLVSDSAQVRVST